MFASPQPLPRILGRSPIRGDAQGHPRRMVKLVSAVILSLGLSACGQKGPLFLPAQQAAGASPAAASSAAAPAGSHSSGSTSTVPAAPATPNPAPR